MKATRVVQWGCQESLVQRNKQTLTKEIAKKKQPKKPPKIMFSKKGLMTKNKEK